MNTQAQDYVPPEDEDYNPIHSSNASRTSKRTTDSQPDVAMADARDSEHPECECNVDVSTRYVAFPIMAHTVSFRSRTAILCFVKAIASAGFIHGKEPSFVTLVTCVDPSHKVYGLSLRTEP